MSPIPAHQSDRKSRGFPGHVLTSSAAFLDESDSVVVRQLHRRLAQELAARVAKSTDSTASGHPRPPASHRTVSRPRRPRRLKRVASSAGGPESSGHLTEEMSSVQALMDLALPRFAMAEGPRQIHPPWLVTSSSPMLSWGTAEDSSPPFSPNWVRERHYQNIPDEGSLFNVSPLSPGLVVWPTRGSGAAPSEGVLLPTMLEEFDDLVLGDPISYV